MFRNLQPTFISNSPRIIQYHFLAREGLKIFIPDMDDFTKEAFPVQRTNRDKIQSCFRIIISSQTDRFVVVDIWIIIFHFLKVSFFIFSAKHNMVDYELNFAP